MITALVRVGADGDFTVVGGARLIVNGNSRTSIVISGPVVDHTRTGVDYRGNAYAVRSLNSGGNAFIKSRGVSKGGVIILASNVCVALKGRVFRFGI